MRHNTTAELSEWPASQLRRGTGCLKVSGAVNTANMMITSGNRSPNRTSIDLPGTLFGAGICAFFLLGLSTLASLPVAIAGGVGLAVATVLVLKMMASEI